MDNGDKQKPNLNNSAAQGGIFSTPDLTVDTEKLAQINQANQVTSAASDKTRVASFFANTDATKQAQQSVITAQPLEGDLVINNVPKKSKMPIIVMVVLLVISMIGIVVLFAVNRPESKDSYSQVKTAFLEFSNFVLNGQVSSGELDDSCIEEETCYFMQAAQSKEAFEKFYSDSAELRGQLEKALAIWDEKTSTDEQNDGINSGNLETGLINKARLAQEISNLIDAYDFIRLYAGYDALTKNDIEKYYLENGESDTQKYIANFYENDHKNKYFRELSKEGLMMSEAVLDNIAMYAQYGCMDDFMNSICFRSQASEEEKEKVDENNLIISNYGAELAVYDDIPNRLVNRIGETNILFNRYESEGK